MAWRRTRRAAAATAVVIAAGLGCSLLAGSAATAAPADPLAGKKYVALGDSYASGLGLAPYAATAAACFRSTNGIATQVAATHGLTLTDVSCSGATIANVLSTPQSLPGGGTVPTQLDAVTSDTDLVSLMIGGNDLGFSTVLPACAALSPAGPLLLDPDTSTCSDTQEPALTSALQGAVAPALDSLLTGIRAKAPQATVVLLGYPALAPTDASTPAAGCFSPLWVGRPPVAQSNSFPFTAIDRAFFAGMSARLDEGQRAAAAKNGAVFVSNLAATDSHTPCAGTADPWLNGITVNVQTFKADPSSMHPNAAGAAHLAEQLAEAFARSVPESSAEDGAPSTGDPSTPGTTTAAATGPTAELAATGSETQPLMLAALGALAGLGAGGWITLKRRRAVRSN